VKRVGILLLTSIVSVLLILTSAEAQPQRRARQQPVRAQNAPTAQPATADQRGTDQVPLTVKVLPAPDANEKAEQEERERAERAKLDAEKAIIDTKLAFETQRIADYTDRLAWFTIFLVFVAIVQAGLFLWQLRLMLDGMRDAKIAANAAQESAEAAKVNAQAVINADRAYLFVSVEGENIAALIGKAAIAPVPQNMEDAPISTLRLTYAFKNYGRTPAVIREISYGTLVAPDIFKAVREYEAVVDLPAHILGAGEKTNPPIMVDDLRVTAGEAQSIRIAETTFWFYGIVVYDDTFGWRRTLKFIWHYGAESNGLRIFSYDEKEERIPQ